MNIRNSWRQGRVVISHTTIWILSSVMLLLPLNVAHAQQSITLEFWSQTDLAVVPVVDQLIAKFEKANPGIKVNAQHFGKWTEIWPKILTAVATKTVPDVVRIKEVHTFELADKGALTRLDEFAKRDGGPKRGDILPVLWDAATYKGGLYGYPQFAYVMVLFYNTEAFRKAGLDPEKPPVTWADMKAYAKKLSNPRENTWGYAPLEYGTREMNLAWFLAHVWQAGGRLWNNDYTRVTINSPEAIRALELLVDMIKDKSMLPPDVPRTGLIESGKIGMWGTGGWAFPTFAKYAPNLRYRTALQPKDKQHANLIGLDVMSIMKDSRNQDAAWKFVSYMNNEENNVALAAQYGHLPVWQRALSQPPFSTDRNWKVLVDALEHYPGVKQRCSQWDELAEKITPHLQDAYFLRKSPKEALDAAAIDANKFWQSIGGNASKVEGR